MEIKFNQLPKAIQRVYLSQAKITKVEVYNPVGPEKESYLISFANGTTRKWVWKNDHWVMS